MTNESDFSPLDDPFSETEDLGFQPWGMELNQFTMLMHLAQFAGFIAPGAGFVLPIVMWATNRAESPTVDEHGKNIINWMISMVIYCVASIFLMFLLIGIPMLIALAICSLIFIIMGAVKASQGEVYEYPLTIKFIK